MLKVIRQGIYASIQDKGRVGYAHYGVPVSGAMDSTSAAFANHILDNDERDAVIEILYGQCVFEFMESTSICLSGADFNPMINRRAVTMNARINVNSGDRLSFGKQRYGVRTYLAVKGGFLTDETLGSRSQYVPVTPYAQLQKGAFVAYLSHKHLPVSNAVLKSAVSHFNENSIDVYEGPEYTLLTQHQKYMLTTTTFTISKNIGRMGYMLDGELFNTIPSMLTSAVMPGTVQLTPAGKLIVLMRDCQVTGGYPRVLQLKTSSISMLAQKQASDKISFRVEK